MMLLGDATLANGQVTISTPVGGFGGIRAVRLTNYTEDVIILGNITGNADGSQQYLMPFQQNVYPVANVRNPPTAYGQELGAAFSTSELLVEWSTDPVTDLPGTYPVTLAIAPIKETDNTDGVVVLAANDSDSIDPSTGTDMTVYNTGPGVVYWSRNEATVLGPTTSASLPVGAGVNLDAGDTVYLLADASGASVSYFAN